MTLAIVTILYNNFVWFLALIAFGIIAAPILTFLKQGWRSRRDDIIGSFNDEAIQSYFEQFHPQLFKDNPNAGNIELRAYYDDQYGRWRYIAPSILLFSLLAVLIAWSTLTVLKWQDVFTGYTGALPDIAVFGIAGAYMYILSSLIGHWWSSDLTSSDIYWSCFRLIIAVPMSYAVTSTLKPELATATSFLLGVFPTDTLLTIARRFGSKNLGLENLPSGGDSELLKLQGIDINCAERLAAEGISTILQLAYADPIKLTIRTNLGFSYIVDIISQALLWLYMEADSVNLRESGIRGSFEVAGLLGDLDSKDAERETKAKQTMQSLVDKYKLSSPGFENVLRQVAADPYSQFLLRVWS